MTAIKEKLFPILIVALQVYSCLSELGERKLHLKYVLPSLSIHLDLAKLQTKRLVSSLH
jgi:hypothetical protein